MKQAVRILALHESMGGESVFGGEISEDGIRTLMHAYLCVTEGIVTKGAFEECIGIDPITADVLGEVEKFLEEATAWSELIKDTDGADTQDSGDLPSMRDIVGVLVTECGLDPKYVLDEMDLWEIPMYIKGLANRDKKRLEEKRLFTFIKLSPWLGDNKRATPKDIITFPWDNEVDEDREFIERNYEQLKEILNGGLQE